LWAGRVSKSSSYCVMTSEPPCVIKYCNSFFTWASSVTFWGTSSSYYGCPAGIVQDSYFVLRTAYCVLRPFDLVRLCSPQVAQGRISSRRWEFWVCLGLFWITFVVDCSLFFGISLCCCCTYGHFTHFDIGFVLHNWLIASKTRRTRNRGIEEISRSFWLGGRWAGKQGNGGAVDGGRKTEDRRQETGDRRQETEDGRRKTEDGRRKTEDGRRKTEDGR